MKIIVAIATFLLISTDVLADTGFFDGTNNLSGRKLPLSRLCARGLYAGANVADDYRSTRQCEPRKRWDAAYPQGHGRSNPAGPVAGSGHRRISKRRRLAPAGSSGHGGTDDSGTGSKAILADAGLTYWTDSEGFERMGVQERIRHVSIVGCVARV